MLVVLLHGWLAPMLPRSGSSLAPDLFLWAFCGCKVAESDIAEKRSPFFLFPFWRAGFSAESVPRFHDCPCAGDSVREVDSNVQKHRLRLA